MRNYSGLVLGLLVLFGATAAQARGIGTPEGCQNALKDLRPFIDKNLTDAQDTLEQTVAQNAIRAVRIFHEGDMLTQDFREDRLNIEITMDNVIKKVGCF